MRKLASALAIAAFLTASPRAASADDTKLPFNPYEKSQKGDWLVLTGTFRREGWGEKKSSCASYARVIKVEDGKVFIAETDQNEGVEKTDRTFPAKETPTLESVFALEGGKVSDVKWTDEKRRLDDKNEIACKKVTFVWKHEPATDEITAWFAPQVKSGGLVAVTYRGKYKQGKDEIETTIKLEVAGYGSGDAKDFGETPDSLLDIEMLASTPGETQLPINPWSTSKVGDWAAYRVSAESENRSESGVMSYEVTKVTKEAVKLEQTVRFGSGTEPAHEMEFARTETPSAAEFALKVLKDGPSDKLEVASFKVVDDKRTVEGREFTCKKTSFSVKDGTTRIRVKLWMSTEVKGPGIVAMELTVKERGDDTTVTFEVGGFGDDDKTEWGKKAEQLGRKKKKKKTDDDE